MDRELKNIFNNYDLYEILRYLNPPEPTWLGSNISKKDINPSEVDRIFYLSRHGTGSSSIQYSVLVVGRLKDSRYFLISAHELSLKFGPFTYEGYVYVDNSLEDLLEYNQNLIESLEDVSYSFDLSIENNLKKLLTDSNMFIRNSAKKELCLN